MLAKRSAKVQELPPERGAGSVSSRSAERPERPASPPLPPSRWPARGHPSSPHRKRIAAAVELAEEPSAPGQHDPAILHGQGAPGDRLIIADRASRNPFPAAASFIRIVSRRRDAILR